MSNDVVIRVENLYKEYRLGTISHGTLRQDFQSWWARIRGKEDPNSIISTVQPSTINDPENPHFLALSNVSFGVKRGEILGIIGRNGAGKSTLLKILSEVTSPTKGTVKIKGRVASLLEVGTGFHPELTGRENIYLNGAILGMTKKEIDKKFDEIVAFAEIDKFIDTPVKRYSSGMYVRLAFAVAAHLEPEILIVDEVLAVGDAQFQRKCLGKIGDVAKGGRTVLFVSHNMTAIMGLCNSALWLDGGNIRLKGETNRIVQTYLHSEMSASGGIVTFEEAINKEAFIRSVTLRNKDGEIASKFDVRSPIAVDIVFHCRKKFSSWWVFVNLIRYDGITVFSTTTGDYGKYKDLISPGHYKARLIIPGCFLGAGTYYLKVGFDEPTIERHDVHECAVEFEISGQVFEYGPRNALLVSSFTWNVSELDAQQ